ncbi:hypothetical protein [Salinarimonas rosea]|uniref:hypothetical protein n=1 Tax=Salinarimonas rosea TaxID=552063 RepID=UPI00041DE34D|nr:hypothetical protein [Salinarimonas rosea]
MPLQNRVTPFGALVATPHRGTLMGNRGCLHDAEGRIGSARWRTRAWIACLTEFEGRRRAPMQPGRYTELFFLDEATAFAAGHRPCAECRRADWRRFAAAWRAGRGLSPDAPLPAAELDRALHEARVDPRTRAQIRTPARLGQLPDGTMVALPEEPGTAFLWRSGRLAPWSFAGYGAPRTADPARAVESLTPAPVLRAFAAGYAPGVHHSAQDG